MNAESPIIKLVWRERDANGEMCDGCGDDCYLGQVNRSYMKIVGGDKLHKLPFALCPDCFDEYQKLDQ